MQDIINKIILIYSCLFLLVVIITFSVLSNDSTNKQDIYCSNLLPFGSIITRDTNGLLVCNSGFASYVSYNAKISLWTSYIVTNKNYNGDCGNYILDPAINSNNQANDNDYLNNRIYQRGHLAPKHALRNYKEMCEQSMYFSNIAPQYGAGFNQALWATLENRILKYVELYPNNKIQVLIGVKYSNKLLNNRIAIPDYFFKILLDLSNNNVFAFSIPHLDNLQGQKPITYITNISSVEQFYSIIIPVSSSMDKNNINHKMDIIWS